MVNGLTTEYLVYYVNVRMLRSLTNLPAPPLREFVNLFTNIANVVVGYEKLKGWQAGLCYQCLPALLSVRLELCQIDKVAAFATLLNELIEFALAVFGHPAAGKDIGYGHAKGDAHDGDG